MINKIISGISNKLFENYGSKTEIYTESVVQNMAEPCFLINHIESDMDMIINPRYYFNSRFDILYFSNEFDKYNDCMTVGCALFSVLEYIPFDNGVIRGTNMRMTFNDDILHFYVDYNLLVSNNLDTVDKMQEIEITQEVIN